MAKLMCDGRLVIAPDGLPECEYGDDCPGAHLRATDPDGYREVHDRLD